MPATEDARLTDVGDQVITWHIHGVIALCSPRTLMLWHCYGVMVLCSPRTLVLWHWHGVMVLCNPLTLLLWRCYGVLVLCNPGHPHSFYGVIVVSQLVSCPGRQFRWERFGRARGVPALKFLNHNPHNQ
jgi:hypothetical protein